MDAASLVGRLLVMGCMRFREQKATGRFIERVQELVGVEDTGNTYKDALASILEAIRWWHEMSTRQASPPEV